MPVSCEENDHFRREKVESDSRSPPPRWFTRKSGGPYRVASGVILSADSFLREVHKVALDFPEVALDDLLVDASAAYLVRDPSRFDVIVTTNFYGDILFDLASELSGS